ncbi:hypothetical protein PIB30_056653 [Stylosanthes scabra]|uniref:Uncharacterized protein n=1 Tax=Stylosanthes scabra TaxID=79078 RepID=A0ABU6ULS6_9FABA|nr:hypothetical protein [Stylosanthes scabra]
MKVEDDDDATVLKRREEMKLLMRKSLSDDDGGFRYEENARPSLSCNSTASINRTQRTLHFVQNDFVWRQLHSQLRNCSGQGSGSTPDRIGNLVFVRVVVAHELVAVEEEGGDTRGSSRGAVVGEEEEEGSVEVVGVRESGVVKEEIVGGGARRRAAEERGYVNGRVREERETRGAVREKKGYFGNKNIKG